MLKKISGRALESVGKLCLKLAGRVQQPYQDIRSDTFWKIYRQCKPFTMTSIERMYGLYNAVKYVISNHIPGDFVECGVWRGGSAMLIAATLKELGIDNRRIFLYDTFEGMSSPSEEDVDYSGNTAKALMDAHMDQKETSVWCLAGIAEVRKNLARTKYPEHNLILVPGKVEETIPKHIPSDGISLLRLDTDWYASTRHELEHLYPLLAPFGVLIIDDYGHWQGCRQAVDEYFDTKNNKLLLHRIDYTGRIAIKTFK